MELEALKRVADRLEVLNLSYCIVGGVAAQAYLGAGRFTEDVDFAVAGADATAQNMNELLQSFAMFPKS